MRRRKRRRTMRTPPSNDVEPASSTHRWKDSSSSQLCVNGICAVRALPSNELIPTSFSSTDKGEHLECAEDNLIVFYDGPGRSEKDAAAVRADNPVPTTRLAIYYFEVTVLDGGASGHIGVGLCTETVRLDRMPGWDTGSYGYHGDDGCTFKQTGTAGCEYGPTFGTEDIIGCCWDLIDDVVFFTKNGLKLERAFSSLRGTLFPTVGMQSKQARVKANFGADSFVFDIDSYAKQQRERVLAKVASTALSTDYTLLSNVVLGYLVHSGYAETATAFAKDAGQEALLVEEQQSMMERKAICSKVMSGDIDSALQDLEQSYPALLKSQLPISFLLKTQKFIEMIVSGAGLEETVEYGKQELAAFRNASIPEANGSTESEDLTLDNVPYKDILAEVYSLLAYVNPAESPSGYLTHQERRDMVAARLNAAILKSQGRPTRSTVEKLICQSECVLDKALQCSNGPAAVLNMSDFY